ncbi:GATOR complex protein MIOS-B [Frankliniella occidentalis]|uniref:GATOR complex protein MIOS-B n=1 Tax=Frankliniella occidentalis TaxID=133901 RepID=A0A6J1S7M1_FRAOC|nr:GATOR complex protein MIOS-B [Frankliniella occidentalis]
MSGVRLEVLWSPVHPDKFVTWGTDINLFEVKPIKDAPQSSFKISETTVAHRLASNSSSPYVKCVDIYPHHEADVLLALGQINGKVVLTTFGPTVFDCLGLAGKELVPRHGRQCNTVAWNPSESNLIAAGLEKHRTDHSVLLWDLQRCPHSNGHSSHHAPSSMEPTRPSAELGLSETAHSLAWLRGQPRCLMVGLNNKHLKLFDFRDPGRAVSSTPTKAVYGLAVDPQADHRLASFVENQIYVWDTRNFEKPVLFLSQNKPVSKVSWCPTRNNLLGTLQRDSTCIGLYDIQPTMVGNDEVEPSFLERAVLPGVTGVVGGVQASAAGAITSFSWHPTHENRLININLSGNLTDYTVFERITLNWSPSNHIVWTHGWRTLKTVCDKDPIYSTIDNEAMLIKKRALSGYGLSTNLEENGDLAESKDLKRLWRWLQLSATLVEEGLVPNNNTGHPGVRSVLKKPEGSQPTGSETSNAHGPWAEINACHISARVYRSEEREHALQLCGWSLDRDQFLGQLESAGYYSRAAAIAVFNLRLPQAVNILRKGAEHPRTTSPANLNIVAVALSGFSDDKTSMWRQQCIASKQYLTDPYLRVMFAFLTAESESYEEVLEENEVTVEDRVAFACCFLSDVKLSEYLRNLTAKLTDEGDLGGILLTGTTLECIPLLQRFLDRTGDIQSISFIAARAFPPHLLKEDSVQEWISNYRNLLDSWKLWTQRAHFDIALSARTESDKPPQQVFVSCNFCAKSVSAFMQGRGRGLFARVPNKSKVCKITSCPNCRKPLPRCSICLLNMGSASGAYSVKAGSTTNRTIEPGSNSDKLAEFANWFTWCQSCRHGGHASHIMHWFSEHLECPVTACACRCMSLDFAAKVISVPVV